MSSSSACVVPPWACRAAIDVHFDSSGSYLEINRRTMYYLVKDPAFGSHLLALEPEAPDFVPAFVQIAEAERHDAHWILGTYLDAKKR